MSPGFQLSLERFSRGQPRHAAYNRARGPEQPVAKSVPLGDTYARYRNLQLQTVPGKSTARNFAAKE